VSRMFAASRQKLLMGARSAGEVVSRMFAASRQKLLMGARSAGEVVSRMFAASRQKLRRGVRLLDARGLRVEACSMRAATKGLGPARASEGGPGLVARPLLIYRSGPQRDAAPLSPRRYVSRP